ncbi:MAG: hypothetical protein ACXVQY_09755 [Actinomycetota bacterium]
MDQIQGKPCRSCDRLVAPGTRVCSCGVPTDSATFKERAEYELKQWKAYKARAQAESA